MSGKGKREIKKNVDLADLNNKADIADAMARRAEALVRYQVAMATLRDMGKAGNKGDASGATDDV